MSLPRVLFVCIGNAARSQMAEAWLTHLAGERYRALSGGIQPSGVHPLTLEVLGAAGVDHAGATSKHVNDLAGPFEFVITTCAEAEVGCPTLRGTRETWHWHVPDPVGIARSTPDVAEQRAAFQRACELIRRRVTDLIPSLDAKEQA